MSSGAILVVDLGTSKAHANLIATDDGRLLNNHAVSYDLIRHTDSMAELHAETIWKAAQDAVCKALDGLEDMEIEALTFSFFGAQLVTLDEDGREVFPTIVSFDGRAGEEARIIRRIVPEEEIRCIVRGGINKEANPCKVLWLSRHFPEQFKKVRYLATMAQYIYSKLGLPFCIERSMRQTLQFHRQDGTLIEDLAAACGVSEDHFPHETCDGDQVIGHIKAFGNVSLPKEIPVLPGGHDCILAQIGCGAIPEGGDILGNVCGTFDILGYLVPYDDVRGREEECLTTPFADTLSFMYGGPTGAELESCVRKLWGHCDGELLTELFAETAFDGEHGSLWADKDWDKVRNDPGALEKYGAQRVFESLVEEITFGLKENYLNLLGKHAKPFSAVRAGGGASRSKGWLQLKADVFDVVMETLASEEVSSIGAAIIAAVAIGRYPDRKTASGHMVHAAGRFSPVNAKRYEQLYQKWKEISTYANILTKGEQK